MLREERDGKVDQHRREEETQGRKQGNGAEALDEALGMVGFGSSPSSLLLDSEVGA